MTKAGVTAKRLRERFEYNPDSGVFKWRFSNRRAKVGKVCGFVHKISGYSYIYVDGEIYLAHRLAWLYVTGDWPKGQIDHINWDRLDNRFANLRDVSPKVNSQNRANVAGATLSGSGYKAAIRANGKSIYLGTFPTKELARAAYVAAKRKMHEGCTI